MDDLVNFTDVLPTLCDIANVGLPDDIPLDGQSFLPQIHGEEGAPRDYSYCWYDPGGSRKSPKVFARTQRYKLYRNGAFYDVSQDRLEKNSLDEQSLSDEQIKVKAMLQTVIQKYKQQGA